MYKINKVSLFFLASIFSTILVAKKPMKEVVIYDNFENASGYTLIDYSAKWSNPFGLGEMAVPTNGDTRDFTGGEMSVSAVPFRTSADFSVFDHIKYFATSNQVFEIPEHGSLMFSADIECETPGTIPSYVVNGTYISSGEAYSATTLDGQQATCTLHMIDFATGQLFDWLVSDGKALALTERLPSSVTGSPIPAGINEIYTQVIKEIEVGPGSHNYAIRYNRNKGTDKVEFLIDGKVVVKVDKIGIPLDVQHKKYLTYPSLGSGESLEGQVNNVVMAHGLFSLLDAFPFQHPDSPDTAVSIPISNRIFGQGAAATFDNFVVTTVEGSSSRK